MSLTHLCRILATAVTLSLPTLALGQQTLPGAEQVEQVAVRQVDRSPFAKAFFMIYADASSTGDPASAGARDVQRGYTTPPGVLQVCFTALVKDPIARYAEDLEFGWSCTDWKNLAMEITPGKGMTLSYNRWGQSDSIKGAVLTVPSAKDGGVWYERAKKFSLAYKAAFEKELVLRQEREGQMRREEEKRRTTLDLLRKQPIVVYPD